MDWDEKVDGLVSSFLLSKLKRNGIRLSSGERIFNEGESAGLLNEELVGKRVTLFVKSGRVIGVRIYSDSNGVEVLDEKWEKDKNVRRALDFRQEVKPLLKESLEMLNPPSTQDPYLLLQYKELAVKLAITAWINSKRGSGVYE